MWRSARKWNPSAISTKIIPICAAEEYAIWVFTVGCTLEICVETIAETKPITTTTDLNQSISSQKEYVLSKRNVPICTLSDP